MMPTDKDIIKKADSLLSYLWYRGYIDKTINPETNREIEELLVQLRVAAEW
jgi:hypothetical protein